MFFITNVIISLNTLQFVFGHGIMLNPPSRSSLWRTNSRGRINYNDNALFCGGFYTQHYLNGGRCGVCGDSFSEIHPQDNENTGKYGQGVIAATYKSGSVIDVYIKLTANHKGSFNYSLCILEDPSLPEPGDDCFIQLSLENGETKSFVNADIYEYVDRVKLPEYVSCDRCVLRWTYRTGNNWGLCENGSQGLGCGAQEHFRNCADIAIV